MISLVARYLFVSKSLKSSLLFPPPDENSPEALLVRLFDAAKPDPLF